MVTPVWLHGFGTSGRVWRRVREEGDQAPDLPGFGASAAGHAAPDFSVDGMAGAVEQAIRAAGLTRYALVGHSMGAKVALVLAARRPAGLAGLALVSPSPPTPEPMTPQGRERLRAAHGDAAALWKQYETISRRPLTPEDWAALVGDGLRADAGAWNAWLDHGSAEDRAADAAQVDVSVLVVSSPQDPVIGPEVVQNEVLARLPGARHELVTGSGHLLPLECGPDLASRLRPWLAGLD